jgi:hypothetical protein
LLPKECGAFMTTLLDTPYNWPIKVESISQSRRKFMLPPARKLPSAANATSINLIHCGHFLSCLYIWHQLQQVLTLKSISWVTRCVQPFLTSTSVINKRLDLRVLSQWRYYFFFTFTSTRIVCHFHQV